MTLDELKALEVLSRHVTVASHRTLFDQDEPAASVYNVIEGALRLYRLLPDGPPTGHQFRLAR